MLTTQSLTLSSQLLPAVYCALLFSFLACCGEGGRKAAQLYESVVFSFLTLLYPLCMDTIHNKRVFSFAALLSGREDTNK